LKFFIRSVSCFVICILCFYIPQVAWANQADLSPVFAKSYVLLDAQSGVILAQKKMDEALPPASMTKMMSAFVVLDEIKKGRISWQDQVTVSSRAAAIDEAQINLAAGDRVTVKELFIAMLVYSANDATAALAEYVGGGTEEGFVAMMNRKAQQLGLKQTHYRVSTGLDLKDYPVHPPQVPGFHRMSAHDTAELARQLLKAYPEVIKTTSITYYTFLEGTARQSQKPNWNLMLPTMKQFYPGVDGLKTGHTRAAGYCFTGTAQRDQLRLISVVMGTDSDKHRFTETKKLLDYGFGSFTLTTLLKSHDRIPQYQQLLLPNGVERTVPVVSKEEIKLPIHTGQRQQYTYQVTWKKGLQAPLAKGTIVGHVRVLYQGQPIPGLKTYDLVTSQSIEKGSWLRLFLRSVGDEVKSWF
jgi:D-alanyl-D-alanine carboxypeptidase (penicillin-binding protein 5/6)